MVPRQRGISEQRLELLQVSFLDVFGDPFDVIDNGLLEVKKTWGSELEPTTPMGARAKLFSECSRKGLGGGRTDKSGKNVLVAHDPAQQK
jgi:hypothetical protein